MGLLAKFKISTGMKALIIVPMSLIISAVLVSCFTLSGTVVLETQGGLGNQMFQYAAACSLSKATQSKLYLVVNRSSVQKGNVSSLERNFGLLQFDIPKEQIVYSDSYFYRFLITPTKKLFSKILKSSVNQVNFFQMKEKKNY